jgi:drug/metabolite transporter (DMT)-like permease
MSFAGMVVAFGLPTPAFDHRQAFGDLLMIGAAMCWAFTTLLIKGTILNRISSEKTMMYQLGVSAPLLALCAWLAGEPWTLSHWPSATAIGAVAYQTLYTVPVTFVAWFALIVRYSAGRLSAFSFLTPLFGVAAGHFVLGDPITPAFLAAVALVTGGLMLVNRAR